MSFLLSLRLLKHGDATSDEELEHFGGEEIMDGGVVAMVDGDRPEIDLFLQLILSFKESASLGAKSNDH